MELVQTKKTTVGIVKDGTIVEIPQIFCFVFLPRISNYLSFIFKNFSKKILIPCILRIAIPDGPSVIWKKVGNICRKILTKKFKNGGRKNLASLIFFSPKSCNNSQVGDENCQTAYYIINQMWCRCNFQSLNQIFVDEFFDPFL